MLYWQPGIFAFVLTLLLVALAKHFFPKWGWVDRPHLYGLSRDPIPYPVGGVIYLVFLLGSLLFLEIDAKLLSLLIGGGFLTLVSIIDDRRGLSPWFRLGIQVLVIFLMILGGVGIEGITNPLGGYLAFDQLSLNYQWLGLSGEVMVVSALFTLFWIVLVVNAMNWLDGIPGMVSGMGSMGGFILFFLSISALVNQPSVAIMSLMLGASCLAFWWFDVYPPKVLIGDSGSMFVGLMLAVIAIFSSGKIATTFLILGFAILDFFYVVIHRLLKKQAPWRGGEWDKYRKAVHLHHRLLKFGLSEKQVLFIVYLFSALFGVSALFIGTQQKLWAIVLLFLTSVTLGFFLRHKA